MDVGVAGGGKSEMDWDNRESAIVMDVGRVWVTGETGDTPEAG